MSRFNNIQDNKFKILLSIREERKQQSMKRKEPVTLCERLQNPFGIFDKRNSAPRTSNDKHSRTRITSRKTRFHITQEDMYKDLNEGRD